jgi:hypothetical protein
MKQLVNSKVWTLIKHIYIASRFYPWSLKICLTGHKGFIKQGVNEFLARGRARIGGLWKRNYIYIYLHLIGTSSQMKEVSINVYSCINIKLHLSKCMYPRAFNKLLGGEEGVKLYLFLKFHKLICIRAKLDPVLFFKQKYFATCTVAVTSRSEQD